jgi:tetratricopeptide (TPR) repeat protein
MCARLGPKLGDNVAVHADALRLLGQARWKCDGPEVALPLFGAHVDLLRRLHDNCDHADLGSALWVLASIQAIAGVTSDAVKSGIAAIEMQQRLEPGGASLQLSDWLHMVAEWQSNLCMHDAALVSMRASVSMHRGLGLGSDYSVVLRQKLITMASMLKETGSMPEALGTVREATSLFAAAYSGGPEVDSSDVASMLQLEGSILHTLGRLDESVSALHRAVDMFRRLHAGGCVGQASALCELGAAYSLSGKHRRALRVYQESIQLFQRLCPGLDHPMLSTALLNRGQCLGEVQQDFDAASSHMQRGLDMRVRLFKGQDHPCTASALDMLGLLHKQMGEVREAVPHLVASVNMYLRLYSNRDHNDVARSMCNLGCVCRALGHVDWALDWLQRSYDMLVRMSGRQVDIDVVAGQLMIAQLLTGDFGGVKRARPRRAPAPVCKACAVPLTVAPTGARVPLRKCRGCTLLYCEVRIRGGVLTYSCLFVSLAITEWPPLLAGMPSERSGLPQSKR